MAEYAVEGKVLKKLVGAARKKPLPFAYNPGKGDDDDYFALHRKRSGDVMAKAAKKDGAGNKAAFGTCKVDGSVMWLTCEIAIPAMAKNLKKYLKSQKISLTVKVTDLSGNLLEEEVEANPDIDLADDDDFDDDDRDDGDDDSDAPQAAAAEPSPAADASEIVARIKAAQPGIAAVPAPVSEKLTAALKAAVELVRSGDLEGAATSVGKIEAVLAKLSAAPAATAAPSPTEPTPSPETGANSAAELVKRAKALQPRIVAAPPEMMEKLQAALAGAVTQIKAQDLGAADAQLGKIEAVLDKLAERAEAAPTASAPETPEQARAAPEPLQEDTDPALAEELGNRRNEMAGLFKAAKNIDKETADEVRTAWAEVERLGKAGDSAAALDAIDDLELRLAEVTPASNVRFQQLRLRWQDAKKQVGSQIAALHSAVVADFPDPDSRSAATRLDEVLAAFNMGLANALDDIANSEHGEARNNLKEHARDIVAEYLTFLATSGLVDHVEENPFTPVSICVTLNQPLRLLDAELAKGAA